MPTFGGWEWILVIIVVLVLFGPKRIPQVAESLGKALKSFRKSTEADEKPQEKVDSVKVAAKTEETVTEEEKETEKV